LKARDWLFVLVLCFGLDFIDKTVRHTHAQPSTEEAQSAVIDSLFEVVHHKSAEVDSLYAVVQEALQANAEAMVINQRAVAASRRRR
jgi:hypothetical protein